MVHGLCTRFVRGPPDRGGLSKGRIMVAFGFGVLVGIGAVFAAAASVGALERHRELRSLVELRESHQAVPGATVVQLHKRAAQHTDRRAS